MASTTQQHGHGDGQGARHWPWPYWLLVVLAFEKIVQHATVTSAFLANWRDIRSTVVVDYRWLVVTGALIGVLFAVAAAGLLGGRRWSLGLLTALALADIAGEFIAQGTIGITMTFSFVVAIVILLLARWVSHQGHVIEG